MEEWNYYKSIQSWEVKYLLTLKERLSWLQGFQWDFRFLFQIKYNQYNPSEQSSVLLDSST